MSKETIGRNPESAELFWMGKPQETSELEWLSHKDNPSRFSELEVEMIRLSYNKVRALGIERLFQSQEEQQAQRNQVDKTRICYEIETLSLMMSRLGFSDKDKVTAYVLYGLSAGQVSFSHYYKTIARTIWEKQKFVDYFCYEQNSEDSNYNRMIRNRLKSLDQKQKLLGIELIDWVAGNNNKGKSTASEFNFYLVKYVKESLNIAQKSSSFISNPHQAIAKAVDKYLETLLSNEVLREGNKKKLYISNIEKAERAFKASLGTINQAIKELSYSLPVEAIEEKLKTFHQTLVDNVTEQLSSIKKQQDSDLGLRVEVGQQYQEIENLGKHFYDQLGVLREGVKMSTDFSSLSEREEEVINQSLLIQQETQLVIKQTQETSGVVVIACTVEHPDVEIPKENNIAPQVQVIEEVKQINQELNDAVETALAIDFQRSEDKEPKTRYRATKEKLVSSGKYTEEEYYLYAKHQKGIREIDGYVHWLKATGERDEKVGKLLNSLDEKKQAQELEAQKKAEELREAKEFLAQSIKEEQIQEQLYSELTEQEKEQLIKQYSEKLLSSKNGYIYKAMTEQALRQHIEYQIKKELYLKQQDM